MKKFYSTFICVASVCSSSPAVAAFGGNPSWRAVNPDQFRVRTPSTVDSNYHCLSARRHSTSRFGSNWNDNGEKDGNFLSKIVDKARAVGSKYLPAIFGPPSKEQRRKELVRREVDETVGALFKNTPFGMVGSAIVKPLLQNMAETFSEQAESVQQIIDKAKAAILQDERLLRRLTGGDGAVQVSAPTSQTSSTTIINGRQTSEVGAFFLVSGRLASGLATVQASNGVITSLQVTIDGIDFNVSPSSYSSSGASGLGKNPTSNENKIIDAEFVEKKS